MPVIIMGAGIALFMPPFFYITIERYTATDDGVYFPISFRPSFRDKFLPYSEMHVLYFSKVENYKMNVWVVQAKDGKKFLIPKFKPDVVEWVRERID